MVTYLYVLKLRDSCYYVGSTSNLEDRLKQHQNGEGAQWTRLHGFIDVYQTTPFDTLQQALDSETRRAAELMLIHGVNKVRGGMFITKPPKTLYTVDDIEFLTTTIGYCLHMNYREVEAKLEQDPTIEQRVSDVESSEESELEVVQQPRNVRQRVEDVFCERCGSNNHYTEECFAATTVDGEELGSDVEDEDDEEGEEEDLSTNDENSEAACSRCGRDNHISENCYAKTTIDGESL
jgi:predicted GIY-YIG superfamily endonuclease